MKPLILHIYNKANGIVSYRILPIIIKYFVGITYNLYNFDIKNFLDVLYIF